MSETPADYKVPPAAFKVPLDAVQLQKLGAFTVIFGQIDWMMGNSIALMLEVPLPGAATLMENTTAGPKLNLFKRLAKKKLTGDMLKLADSFYKAMSALIENRNHIMHGMWGIWIAPDHPANNEAAAVYAKSPGNALKIGKLDDLIAQAAEQSFAIATIFHHVSGREWIRNDANPPIFLIGSGPPTRPPQELLGLPDERPSQPQS